MREFHDRGDFFRVGRAQHRCRAALVELAPFHEIGRHVALIGDKALLANDLLQTLQCLGRGFHGNAAIWRLVLVPPM